MTTALYSRVSTNLQQTGLESQKRALEDWCKLKGIEDYVLYEDFAISGGKCSRPQLDKMLRDVKQGKIKQVVVFSFSRFARSTSFLMQSLDLFLLLKVNFVSLTESLDLSTPLGRAMLAIIGAINTLEKEQNSEKVRNGMISARQRGKRIGRPSTVKSELVLTLHNEGYTQREIAKMLSIGQSTVARAIKKHDSKQISSNHFDSETSEP